MKAIILLYLVFVAVAVTGYDPQHIELDSQSPSPKIETETCLPYKVAPFRACVKINGAVVEKKKVAYSCITLTTVLSIFGKDTREFDCIVLGGDGLLIKLIQPEQLKSFIDSLPNA